MSNNQTVLQRISSKHYKTSNNHQVRSSPISRFTDTQPVPQRIRPSVLLLIILSFPYRIFLNLTVRYLSGVSPPSRPDSPSRSRRVPAEGAARAPASPSWRAHQPPPLARRRRRLLLTGLRPRPHCACVAQTPPSSRPFRAITAALPGWAGRASRSYGQRGGSRPAGRRDGKGRRENAG